MTVTVDNAAIDDVSCGPDLLEVTETVTVEPMESSTFAALTLEAQTQYGIDREFELDSIGCCDGAYPFDEFVCGADPFPMTGEGLCFGYEATGIFTADVSASGLNDDLTVARENDLLYRMF